MENGKWKMKKMPNTLCLLFPFSTSLRSPYGSPLNTSAPSHRGYFPFLHFPFSIFHFPFSELYLWCFASCLILEFEECLVLEVE